MSAWARRFGGTVNLNPDNDPAPPGYGAYRASHLDWERETGRDFLDHVGLSDHYEPTLADLAADDELTAQIAAEDPFFDEEACR